MLKERPYSRHIEEVIYLFASGQTALPASEQTTAMAIGSLEYLEYLEASYAPPQEGPPTAVLYPRWDHIDESKEAEPQNPTGRSTPEAGVDHGGTLRVDGLPAWALQFQTGLLALRLGYSARALASMENAFTCYEAWLPRSGICVSKEGVLVTRGSVLTTNCNIVADARDQTTLL